MVLPHPNGFSTRLRFCWLTSYPQWRIVRPSMAESRLVVFCANQAFHVRIAFNILHSPNAIATRRSATQVAHLLTRPAMPSESGHLTSRGETDPGGRRAESALYCIAQ